MGSSIYQLVFIALGGCIVGALVGWSIQAAISKRRIGQLTDRALIQQDDITAQRDQFANKYARSKSEIQKLEANVAKRNDKLKSVVEKTKLLAKNVLTLRTERENTKIKLSKLQTALTALRQQTTALRTEFDKTREFYKRELLKSLNRRKGLEDEIKEVQAEKEAFVRQVDSSVLEHGSEENMVIAAQLRFGQLEVLERNINKLEAENAQLRQDEIQLRQDLDARERDLTELEELRVNNKQLVNCVEALESSRKEHESDAEQYRQQADESEKLSDTLRLKLNDLEQSFADIEEQQSQAIDDARKAAVVPMLRKQR